MSENDRVVLAALPQLRLKPETDNAIQMFKIGKLSKLLKIWLSSKNNKNLTYPNKYQANNKKYCNQP